MVEPTPLRQNLNEVGDVPAKVISVICVIAWLNNIGHLNDMSHSGWLNSVIYLRQGPEGEEGALKVIIPELLDSDKNIGYSNPIRTWPCEI